jgi:hypothetical protein
MAFKVCTALGQDGIKAVLTGGSAATVYAPEAYQSRDADFIASWYSKEREFDEVMKMLGFAKAGRVFSHPQSMFTLDFPDEEIRIGETFVRDYDTLEEKGMYLHILRPVDSVCDRLASFYWYQDRSALKAAVAVAVAQKVNLYEVETWSAAHQELAKFAEFKERVFLALDA